jgi:uncharacterized membrane protein YfcA
MDALLSNLHGLPPNTIAMLAVILAASGLMSGLSGFGFSAIGAICLWLLPPTLAVPLLMALSTANQVMSLGQLRSDVKPVRQWWPNGPAPYLLGGVVGVPIGLWLLHVLPTAVLMAVFGAFLIAYAAYAMIRPNGIRLQGHAGWRASALVGAVGGMIGGFTAFPGAAVVIWTGSRGLPKAEARGVVQPYILVLQVVSLVMLALNHPQTFGPRFWSLLVIMLPVVLPSTLLGVRLYRGLSDINFRRIAFMLLGTSGLGIFLKGAIALGIGL